MVRLRRFLLRTALLLAVAALALYAARRPVAEQTARWILESRGLTDAEFRVVEIGWREAVLADIALPSAGVEAGRVQLAYDLAGISEGMLDGLRIQGLRVDASDGLAERIGLLAAPFAQGGAGRRDSLARLEAPIRRIRLDDARLARDAPAAGVVTIDGSLDLAAPAAGVSELRIGLAFQGITGEVTLRSEGLGAGASISAEGSGRVLLAEAAAAYAPAAGLTGGEAGATLSGSLPMPDEPSLSRILDSALSFEGELRLAEAATGAGASVSADLGWRLKAADGALRLALVRPARIELHALPPGAFAAAHLPEPAVAPVAITLDPEATLATWQPAGDGGRLAIEAAASLVQQAARAGLALRAEVEHGPAGQLAAPATATVEIGGSGLALDGALGAATLEHFELAAEVELAQGGSVTASGPVSARLSALRRPDFEAGSAVLDGRMRGGWSRDGWRIAAEPGFRIALDGAILPDAIRLEGTTQLSLDRAMAEGAGAAARLELSGSVADLAGVAAGSAFAQGRGDFALTLDAAGGGDLRVDAGAVVLPAQSVAIGELAARYPVGGDTAEGIVLAAEVRDRQRQPRFTPLALALSGGRAGSVLSLAGSLGMGDGKASLPLAVTADLAAATGEAVLGPGRIDFRRKRLQPADLSSQFAEIRNAEGSVRVSGTAVVDAADNLKTRLTLGLQGLSIQTAEVEIEGLAGNLNFSPVTPLTTAGVQEVTMRRLISGVPLDNARARFTLMEHRNGVEVQFRDATAQLVGGEVSFGETSWDTAAEVNSINLKLRDISLGRLLSDWQIEGVSGSGTLSGSIPVRFDPGGIVISDGRVDSQGPGAIAVDWGAARDTLVGSGQQVELAVTALEDFRYDALTVGISLPPGGEMTLAVGLDGANPNVLDGYPFRFNINLTGRLAPILDALREGRRIGADLIRGPLGVSR